MTMAAAAQVAVMGDEIVPAGPVTIAKEDPGWGLDYVGVPEQTGTTWYDYQHNGSMSRMVAYGSDGTVHVCWMKGLSSGQAADRQVYYNRKTAAGTWEYGTTGFQISTVAGSGYCTMDLTTTNEAVVAYHGPSPNNICYIWHSGTGPHALPASPTTNPVVWPHVAVDSRNWIHVVAQTNPVGTVYYTRSENGGTTWQPWVQVAALGTAASVSQTVTADPVSGKVAIGYTKPVTTSNTQADVYVVESLNGQTWNFASPTNITSFATGGHPMSSNSRAWDDVSLLYDNTGNLHAAYTTNQYPTPNNGGMIWHWSQATGHRKVTGTYTANAWTALNAPGAWRRAIDRPSLGQNAGGDLFIQWGQCTTPGDVSSATAAYGNWDVYATYSADNGQNWQCPVNVTATATPGAVPGQCLSENWANLAKKVSDKLHIHYIKDLDAGGIPQTEGTWTLNPVIYQGVPVDSLVVDLTATLTPIGGPIVIPAGGGSFNFNATLYNGSPVTQHFDVWIMVQLPSGTWYGPVLGPLNLTLPAGANITRERIQNIPGSAPAGTYVYRAYLGEYGWNVWDENSFTFSKSGVDATGGGDWSCSDWDDLKDGTVEEAQPQTAAMASVSPNPFNPTAMISYDLPEAADVKLTVYNVAGAEVAQLVNGRRDAGSHVVAFDGSHLASGVYLYKLQAGNLTFTEKMILLK